MSKILEKRHKRKVARAKARVKLSEPDVRTPEQIKAAREASRAPTGRGGPQAHSSAPASQNRANRTASTAAKADG
ncbi:MAG: hypothetical protein ABI972_29440 [Acidobacteriota bacterium]